MNNYFYWLIEMPYGDAFDLVLFKDLVESRRCGEKISIFNHDRFHNRNIEILVYKILPVINPLNQELCWGIDYDKDKELLSKLDTTDDGYLNTYHYYKESGFNDRDIISIFTVHAVKNVIKGKNNNTVGISKLIGKVSSQWLKYLLLIDSI